MTMLCKQFKKINPTHISPMKIVQIALRQQASYNRHPDNNTLRPYAVVGKIFSGIRCVSGWLFSGALLMKKLADFFGNSDVQLGTFAVVAAGSFLYLKSQVSAVRTTQADHTNRLASIQGAQREHGAQLTAIVSSVGALNDGQGRLEESLGAARSLLGTLQEQVSESSETLQNVSGSVLNLVTKLEDVEEGMDTLNLGFDGLKTTYNNGNDMLNQRFSGFEGMVSGLSSRVDDGFTQADQLNSLLQENIVKLRELIGDNSTQVGTTIGELRTELQQLSIVFDGKMLATQGLLNTLDSNAQERDNALRKDMQASIQGIHGKLDHIIARPQLSPTQSRSPVLRLSHLPASMSGRSMPENRDIFSA